MLQLASEVFKLRFTWSGVGGVKEFEPVRYTKKSLDNEGQNWSPKEEAQPFNHFFYCFVRHRIRKCL